MWLRLRRLHGQLRRFPGGDSAGELADLLKACPLQQACPDRRAVAAGAIDKQLAVLRQFRRALGQMIQRDAQTARDEFLLALARARTSIASGGGRDDKNSAANGALYRSVLAINSGRASKLCNPFLKYPAT